MTVLPAVCPGQGPHRLLAGFGSVRICFLATGCTSAHVVALGTQGQAFTWGRNDAGQLGHGDMVLRPGPERVASLEGKNIKSASTGKAHTVFVADDGELLACGSNKHGAVGNGTGKKAETVSTPAALATAAKFTSVSSGTNFNLAIDTSGDVWSWGWSEFGVLGHGTDGEHNTTDSSIKLSYIAESTPKRVVGSHHLNCEI